MGDLFLLNERQIARISPHFPHAHGVPRVGGRRGCAGSTTACSRRMLQTIMGRARRSAPASCAGAVSASSTASVKHRSRSGSSSSDAREGASHGGEPLKKRAVPHRIGGTRRTEFQASHCLRRGRPARCLAHGQSLIAGRGYDSAASRQALLRHYGLYSVEPGLQDPLRLRQGAPTPAPQGREAARQIQGLAALRNALRPRRAWLLLSHLQRSSRYLPVPINES